MRRALIALALLALSCFPHQANAQSGSLVVATCGTLPLAFRPGQTAIPTVDVNGNQCISGSISASTTGFAPGGTFANLTVTNVSADVALPAGSVVAVQNTGTTTVSCNITVGAGVAVANQTQVPASSTVYLTVGGNTHISCIDQTGSVSNIVAIAGGTGLGTGFGGGGGGGGGSSAIVTWAGSTLGPISNYGTSPGAVIVPAFNAFVTNTPPVSQSGTWTTRVVGNAGAAFDFAGQNAASPANAVLTGCQFNTTPTTIVSTNSSPCQLDSAGNLLVNIKAGSASGTVAQGSTTSGQQGNLVQGAVTTTPPTYVTAQTNPLSLDTAGNLRVTAIISSPTFNANGQAVMASSSPQVIASDQRASTANTSVPISVSTATTTQLVAISGSTKIYVTSFDVIAGGTGNITFVYGTGASCGTGTTALTGAYPLVAQAGIAKGDGNGAILITPSGQALCVTTSQAVQMSGSVSFQQF